MIDEFNVIVVMNEAMLKMVKDKNENYEKNLKIKEYLKDKAFFFKIEKDKACKILQIIGVREESIETVYNKLIAPNVFYDLLNRGEINIDDENLVIKYKTYENNSIFNN